MRKGFKDSLVGFGEVAKAKKGLKEVKKIARAENVDMSDRYEPFEEILDKADERLERAAKEQFTDVETQKKIHMLQIQKQQIMEEFKLNLACLDDPNCNFEEPDGERKTEYDDTDKTFTYADDKGDKRSATFGEVITDMDFDIFYNLDKNSTPKKQIEKYLLARAKKELMDLLDKQILLSEIASSKIDPRHRDAYKEAKNDRETEIEKEKNGFISEKIVRGFLKKLSIDNNLPFVVKEADIHQDVIQVMDFIVHKLEGAYGYKVEDGEVIKDGKVHDFAIQFTLEESKRVKKEKQIARLESRLKTMKEEKIKDIALVIFSDISANKLKGRWEEEGRIAGGPGRYMTAEIQEKLFNELLKGLYTKEEIDLMWKNSHDQDVDINTETVTGEDELKKAA